jgi:hypothetical protein
MWTCGPSAPELTITCPPALTVSCLAEVPDPDINQVQVGGGCGSTVVTWVSDVQEGTGCPLYIVRTYKAVDACMTVMHADYHYSRSAVRTDGCPRYHA